MWEASVFKTPAPAIAPVTTVSSAASAPIQTATTPVTVSGQVQGALPALVEPSERELSPAEAASAALALQVTGLSFTHLPDGALALTIQLPTGAITIRLALPSESSSSSTLTSLSSSASQPPQQQQQQVVVMGADGLPMPECDDPNFEYEDVVEEQIQDEIIYEVRKLVLIDSCLVKSERVGVGVGVRRMGRIAFPFLWLTMPFGVRFLCMSV
jgi:hypothetical protein